MMRKVTRRRLTALLVVVAPLAALLSASGALAATAPNLGSAASFAILAGTTVTNTGSTTINGSLGVSPGSAVTGFPPGTVTGGTIHAADAVALQAQNDVITAYNALAGQACTGNKTGIDLGGLTLTPGVYCFSSSAQLTGTLTLDAQGNSAAVFIFQIVSALNTAPGSSVQVINGGTGCNVYWQVGSSATLGTTTAFKGNILALTSIALQTGASLSPGRALARNGATTMDTNTVSIVGCSSAASSTATPTTTATVTPASTTIPATAIPATTTPAAAIPTVAPATTPTSTGTVRLPSTGGAPPQGGEFPWIVAMLAAAVASLGAMALGLSVRTQRRRAQ
ncbi:MAG: ice-binding family protein [Dehalococcoidia bacterium]